MLTEITWIPHADRQTYETRQILAVIQMRTFSGFCLKRHVHWLGACLVGILAVPLGVDLKDVVGHSVGGDETRPVDNLFAVLRGKPT